MDQRVGLELEDVSKTSESSRTELHPLAPPSPRSMSQSPPPATQAQVLAQIAALQVQITALQAQVEAVPALVRGIVAAALAAHNAPAIVAAAAAIVAAIGDARQCNAHDSDKVYVVRPRSDGTPPPGWPAAFNRVALMHGPIEAVDVLLADYGLPPLAGNDMVRRNQLAWHIGTMRA